MSRFVRPQTRTLTLANGDQLTVRERLTAGEQRAQFARMYTPGANGRYQANPLMVGTGVILAYLLDWNLKNDQDQLVPIRDLSPEDLHQVIDSLDPDSFNEIRTAIEAHEAEMVEARTQKNDPAWRDGVISDLIIARRFGWRYEWVRDLDADVHSILVDELTAEHARAEADA